MIKNIPAKYKKTGDFIRKLLDEKRSSQKDLANFLKRTHSQVSKLCSGYVRPTPEVLTGLVDFFGVSADDILRGGFLAEKNMLESIPHKTEIKTILVDHDTSRKVEIPMVNPDIINRLLTQIEKKDEKIEKLTSEINRLNFEIAAMMIRESGGDDDIIGKLPGGGKNGNKE